ncbi:hypothetical protein KJ693_00100 [bacterium]|nr:hypothetical protein [bacterium]MBU1613693.1 hypothetical protein [bacterium]
MKLQPLVLGLVLIIILTVNGIIFYFGNRPLEFEPVYANQIETAGSGKS